MNMQIIISACISIGGFLITVLSLATTFTARFAKLEERVASEREQDLEHNRRAEKKFTELYDRTAGHSTDIMELKATMQSVANSVSRMEDKLDRILEREKTIR